MPHFVILEDWGIWTSLHTNFQTKLYFHEYETGYLYKPLFLEEWGIHTTTYNIFRLNFIFMYMQEDIHETRYFIKTFKNYFTLAISFPKFSSIFTIFFQKQRFSLLQSHRKTPNKGRSTYFQNKYLSVG